MQYRRGFTASLSASSVWSIQHGDITAIVIGHVIAALLAAIVLLIGLELADDTAPFGIDAPVMARIGNQWTVLNWGPKAHSHDDARVHMVR